MQNLKFRVWNGSMFVRPHQKGYEFQPWYLLSFSGEIVSADNQGAFVDSNQDKYVIQQFTGLLDKNKKEIYDGDILKCKSYDGWFDEVGHYYIGEVEFRSIQVNEYYETGWCVNSSKIPVDCEVIGNVFENPELFK